MNSSHPSAWCKRHGMVSVRVSPENRYALRITAYISTRVHTAAHDQYYSSLNMYWRP